MTPAQQQSRRQAYLEWLYRQDGRHARSHPQHGLYTGLFQGRLWQLLEFDKKVAVGE